MSTISIAARLLIAPCFLVTAASAQWSANPNVNNAVGDAANEQVTPKIAVDGTGGTWISWFDQASGNYDVHAQHLDAHGQEILPHNGVAVSTNPSNSSLVDWDLIGDGAGGCVIVFSDARAGSDLDVYAYRLDANGNQLWGANGVALSNNNDFEPAPRVCMTSDGNFIVVWARLPSPGDGTIRVQKLDANGNPQFAAEGFPITGAPGEDLAFCDVVAADNGGFIVQWLRDISTFLAPRHIRAQKFDAAGAPLWPAFVPVYDAGPVPIAYQPIVEPDGAGGAYFCWHRSLANVYDCLVQHVDSNGTQLFPHNGVIVSTEPARWELDPSLAVLSNGELIVAYNKRNSAQSQWGVGAQKLSAAGALLWTSNGVELAPVDGINESFERCLPSGDGAIVLWFEQPSALPAAGIRAQRVDGSGNVLWTVGGISVCSNMSSKDDLVTCIDSTGVVRAAWSDQRNDPNDIYAQDVNPDGTLGDAAPGSAYCAGDGQDVLVTTACPCSNFGQTGRGCASSFNAAGAELGAHGLVASDDVVLDGSGMNATGSCIFLKGDQEDVAGVVFGDGLRCAAGTLLRMRTVALAGGTASFPGTNETITLSARGSTPVGSGALGSYAVYYRNAAAAFCPPATFNASNGYRIVW